MCFSRKRKKITTFHLTTNMWQPSTDIFDHAQILREGNNFVEVTTDSNARRRWSVDIPCHLFKKIRPLNKSGYEPNHVGYIDHANRIFLQ